MKNVTPIGTGYEGPEPVPLRASLSLGANDVRRVVVKMRNKILRADPVAIEPGPQSCAEFAEDGIKAAHRLLVVAYEAAVAAFGMTPPVLALLAIAMSLEEWIDRVEGGA
jgi:hypothetical protein